MSEQKQGPDPLCKRCDGTGEVGGDYGLTPHHCDCRASPKILSEQNVQVTQADRDAAADLIELYWRRGCGVDRQMQNLADSIRAGHSAGPFPAAFARYRKAILSEAATMTDYDAAREVAFELGVPDIQGPRQQEILARAFASHREKAKTETLEPQSVSTDHVMGPSRLNHGNAQCINCLATDLELRVLGPVCPAAKAKGTPHA